MNEETKECAPVGLCPKKTYPSAWAIQSSLQVFGDTY